MITKIETTQALDTMGEATAEDLSRWCEHLEEKLTEEYPEAEIVLREGGSFTTLRVEDDENPEAKADVQEFINRVWDKWL